MVTSGMTSAGNVASTAISAVANAVTQAPALPASSLPAMAGAGAATVGAGGAAIATQAVSYNGPGTSVNIGNGGGTLRLPDGWGAGLGNAGNAGGATTSAAPMAEPVSVTTAPASTTPVRSAGTGPLLGGQGSDDDETHHGTDYGRSAEVFADGRVIAPAVIGGDPLGDR
ncbi:hypothetical protein NS506_00717 [Nocardia seriolae]|uniref:Uncharacterized protein n=1 Tax=Nocardia seriolae TaxID=37332 RepID=A0ABC9Z5Y9_9NOCA|nr:hypothetical protein NS506_00717 [Nocardia seriolae]BAW03356.1 conserved hypothetical protein [Nocardia seriolae]GAM51293.1 hypothetical protein NS07_v2contig00228-0008 [Nocardia seriolae]GAP33239.1 hypothetical protein NSK11_contig00228-0001 [Nocardia seriolae]